jgi:8-amino-7-oxononanoate synthase
VSRSIEAWIDDQAAVRKKRNLVRTLGVRSPDSGIVDLAGNDYLGLATDQRVIDAAARALRVWGTGATASRVVTGSTALHEELEDYLSHRATWQIWALSRRWVVRERSF